jgi:hypothetical protein
MLRYLSIILIGTTSLLACSSDSQPAPECSASADCLARAWSESCDGDWQCASGRCLATCRVAECAAAQDCEQRQWIPNCGGHWDCVHSECRPICDTVVCRQAADCVLLGWSESCEGYWECGEGGSCRAVCHGFSCNEQIPFHPPTLDSQGGLLPWIPYHQLVETVLGWIRQCPTGAVTGLPWYLQYPSFRYQNMCPSPWPHNPAGLYAMMVETLVRYLPYSGDRSFIEPTRAALDRLITDSTPAGFAWPHVPYASADNSGRYQGGSAEGFEGIEPDKVAQAGVAYLRFAQLTGEAAYREEARHCALVLADRIREGDENRSPWPFRVNARTGAVLEEYSSDLVWPIALFDELERDGASTPAMAAARARAWEWLRAYPLTNGKWKGYFEDVPLDAADINREQYTPGELARYVLLHPERDPAWRDDVPVLLDWIRQHLGDTSPKWHDATGIREQYLWPQVSGSHTARYASLRALWSQAGGDEDSRLEALRSFALASYMARDDGVVIFSPCDDSVWFTDGYFDYVPHFLDGMAALPEMAPAGQDHLLSSTSIITNITYAPGRIAYRTYHPDGAETLRLTFTPDTVTGDGVALPHTFDPLLGVLHITRRKARDVEISGR